MASMITFVRFVSHDETSGHFNPLLRNQLDGCTEKGISIQFEDLSPYPREIRLELLFSKLASSKTQHVYFEWMHDMPNFDKIDRKLNAMGITWSVTASISELWNTSENNSQVFKMLTQLNDCKSLLTIFVFDDLLIRKLNFENILFTPIPQFENVELDTLRRPCCSWFPSSDLTIGIVGQLYGYRGVNKLISIVLKKRRFAIFLWGNARWSTVDPLKRLMLSFLICRKRKYIFDRHLLTDKDLNHAFTHLDAIYVDGSNYPGPSGIAVRARNLGIPVLLEDGESYLKAKSFLDHGILVGAFSRMSQKEIKGSVVFGKSVNPCRVAKKVDQQRVFLSLWSEAFV